MDQELKEKWLRALRGGKYRQTRGKLRDNDGFCCLGVLCDVYNPKNWREKIYSARFVDYFYGGGTGFAPIELLSKDKQIDLSDMNDNGAGFKEIADWIEENIVGEAY